MGSYLIDSAGVVVNGAGMTTTATSKRLRLSTEVESEPGYEWVTTRWLRRQIYEQRVVSYRVSGRVLIDLNDLDAMVDAGRREAHQYAHLVSSSQVS